MNPWNLTARQVQVLEAMARHGTRKLVARELNVGLQTVDTHLAKAYRAMNKPNKLMAVLAFDRWVRAQ